MADFDELVRNEAYLIWQAEGCPHGAHDRHWALAVERVTERKRARHEAPIIPLSLHRIALSLRQKKNAANGHLRASA